MPVMQTFNTLQAQQNARFGHSPTSALSVFDAPSTDDRTFDAFSDMARHEGGNADFCRQYGNGDGNGAIEIKND